MVGGPWRAQPRYCLRGSGQLRFLLRNSFLGLLHLAKGTMALIYLNQSFWTQLDAATAKHNWLLMKSRIHRDKNLIHVFYISLL